MTFVVSGNRSVQRWLQAYLYPRAQVMYLALCLCHLFLLFWFLALFSFSKEILCLLVFALLLFQGHFNKKGNEQMWKYAEKHKMTTMSTISLYLNISNISQSPCEKKRAHAIFFHFTEKKREELRVQVTGSTSAWGLWSNSGKTHISWLSVQKSSHQIVFLKFYSKEHQGSKEVHGGQQVLSKQGRP